VGLDGSRSNLERNRALLPTIHDERSRTDQVITVLWNTRIVGYGTADQCTNSGHELEDAEWFCEVVTRLLDTVIGNGWCMRSQLQTAAHTYVIRTCLVTKKTGAEQIKLQDRSLKMVPSGHRVERGRSGSLRGTPDSQAAAI
jgi:hypothetical protein